MDTASPPVAVGPPPATKDADAPAPSSARRRRRINITLWVLQALAAIQFALAGAPKVFTTTQFIASVDWAKDLSPWLLRFIGTAEMLGALGLILPRLTRILPVLTPLAALGLFTIMVLSIGFHFSRGEWNVAFNAFLAVLAGVIAYGRWKWAP